MFFNICFLHIFRVMVGREVDGLGFFMCRSQGLCWQSLAALGTYVGGVGPLSRPKLAVLGRSRGLNWRSWLGAYVGGLGPLSEPKLAVSGRSLDVCWRAWAALGA